MRNTFAHRMGIGCLVAGLVMGLWGVVAHEDHGDDRVIAEPASGMALVPAAPGLEPLDRVVRFWQQRADAGALDYLSRTELGFALLGRARESADPGDHEHAEAAFREALALNSSHVPARLGLARALAGQHRFRSAHGIATTILEEDQGSVAAMALAGDASLELGEYEAAADFYGELVVAERSAPVVSRLARLTWVEGRPTEAVALAAEALDLSESLALRPHEAAHYWFQLGHYRFAAGDSVGAVAALERALTIAPGHLGAAERLAFVYASTGNLVEAERLYLDLIATAPAADLHGAYADVLAARDDIEAAERHERLGLELARSTIDQHPAERRHLARFLTRRDPARAVELAQADLAERHDIGAHDTLAWALYQTRRYDEAARAIEPALAHGTKDASLLYHAGAIAAATGDLDSARRLVQEALALNPRFDPVEGPAASALLARLAGQSMGR